jgi:hypothetical protein
MTEKLDVPKIDWRNVKEMWGKSFPGKDGYVGTFNARIFSYGYVGGSTVTEPWRLVTMLPGYSNKWWTFSTETDAEAFAQVLLTTFLSKIFAAEEADNA